MCLTRLGILPKTANPVAFKRVWVRPTREVSAGCRIDFPNDTRITVVAHLDCQSGGASNMMRPSDTLSSLYVCTVPVDFRKGINGLAALVESQLALDPFSEQLFVFRNRRQDKVKILYWECHYFQAGITTRQLTII